MLAIKKSMHTKPHPSNHICICIYIHIYLHVNKYLNIHTYIHACIQTNKQISKQTNKQTNEHTNIQTCVHTCIHTYIHSYIHTYIHRCACFKNATLFYIRECPQECVLYPHFLSLRYTCSCYLFAACWYRLAWLLPAGNLRMDCLFLPPPLPEAGLRLYYSELLLAVAQLRSRNVPTASSWLTICCLLPRRRSFFSCCGSSVVMELGVSFHTVRCTFHICSRPRPPMYQAKPTSGRRCKFSPGVLRKHPLPSVYTMKSLKFRYDIGKWD